MKKITPISLCILLFSLLSACDTTDGPDCFKKQGKQHTETLTVEAFDKISIDEGIELIITQNDQQQIEITAGKNRISDLKIHIQNGELQLSDDNTCLLLQNYHPITVKVSTPTLKRIYSSSQYDVSSEGVLRFPKLKIDSGITQESASGIFDLSIDNEYLEIQDNVSAVYRIQGKTNLLQIRFWGNHGRFEGSEFKAHKIDVYQRSTNDMVVYPIDELVGSIRSTGNVVLKHVPPLVEVEEFFTGHVVYP